MTDSNTEAFVTLLRDGGPYGADAISAIQKSAGLDDGPDWEEFFSALDKDSSPTPYIFRCVKCGKLGGYQDCD